MEVVDFFRKPEKFRASGEALCSTFNVHTTTTPYIVQRNAQSILMPFGNMLWCWASAHNSAGQ